MLIHEVKDLCKKIITKQYLYIGALMVKLLLSNRHKRVKFFNKIFNLLPNCVVKNLSQAVFDF